MAINELYRLKVCRNVSKVNFLRSRPRVLSNLITSLNELPSLVLETMFERSKKSIKGVFISRVIPCRNVLAAPRNHSLFSVPEANTQAAHFQFCCFSRISCPLRHRQESSVSILDSPTTQHLHDTSNCSWLRIPYPFPDPLRGEV